jgi:crotonobetainyl-CoA:carnitine CoA-transferase CaiB-like acyl-CoA transferase
MVGPLEGLRVLDLSLQLPGPYASQLLVDLGADVLKVEPPGGDPARVYPALFAAVNRGKRSIVLDLKTLAGRDRILDLVSVADVFLEGFRPGVAARLGVDAPSVRERNPGIVYCSISGYGQTGPLAREPGHDLNYQAYAGLVSSDCPPRPPATTFGDLSAGLYAAFAICAAVRGRERHGRGEYIDVSITDLLVTWTLPRLAPALAGEPDFLTETPHYGVFETADAELVTIGVVHEEHFWSRLCEALALPAELAGATYAQRLEDPAHTRRTLAQAVREHTAEEVIARLRAADVPVAPVLDPVEAVQQEHFGARGTVAREAGTYRFAHPARFLYGTTGPAGPAPELDANAGEGFEDGGLG